MKVQWAVLAEGFVHDARGAVTAVGINQNVLVTPNLPIRARRGVLLILTGEPHEFKSGRSISFTTSVTSPTGQTLMAQSAEGKVGDPKWLDVPGSMNLVAESVIEVTEYGTHIFHILIDIDDEPQITAEVEFYVRAAEDTVENVAT
ncbi:hypothetical protein [Nonomuraea jabiensis]|uniref:hypothetical protein n=1 Tax=Nonomuraea jabiensis TaxID=882448 RepID=UPI003D730820